MGIIVSRPVCLFGGLLYPAYASFKALEASQQNKDTQQYNDKQWLTYWIVYSLTTSIETVTDKLLFWFYGYYEAKMILLLWMMLPQTRGAGVLYEKIVYPLMKRHENVLDQWSNFLKTLIFAYLKRMQLYIKKMIKHTINFIQTGNLSRTLDKMVEENFDKIQPSDD